MVNRLWTPWPHIYSADVTGIRYYVGNHEALVEIQALGRNRERRAHLHFQIGLAQLPSVGELRRLRSFRSVALGRSQSCPAGQCGNVGVREPALVEEVRLDRQPRRHGVFGGYGGNQRGPLRGVLVAQQAEWRNSARAV